MSTVIKYNIKNIYTKSEFDILYISKVIIICFPKVLFIHYCIRQIILNICYNLFQVNIGLECMAANLKTLKRKFVRLSSQATITHLKKFIAKKVLDGMDKYRDVSVIN